MLYCSFGKEMKFITWKYTFFFLINVKYLTLQTILFTHFEIIKSRKIFVLDCKSTNIRWRNFARRENFSINSLE